jgi:isocitrate lyase
VTTNIMSGDAEEAQFQQEVAELKQWWTDSRWRFTRRAYTAEQIVSKRGTIKIEYPSNQQSKKLWKLIEGRFKVSSEARRPFLFVGEPVGIGS